MWVPKDQRMDGLKAFARCKFKYLLQVIQPSLEDKRHWTIKDVILVRLFTIVRMSINKKSFSEAGKQVNYQ